MSCLVLVLLHCRLIEAVATLRREVAPHTNTAKLPLMRRAELAAARAVPAATAVHKLLTCATWSDAAAEPATAAAAGATTPAGRLKGRKAGTSVAAAAAAAGVSGGGGGAGLQLSSGADEAYDAAVAEHCQAQEAFTTELAAQQQWYIRNGHVGGRGGVGAWGQQQQQQNTGFQVQDVSVLNAAEGLLSVVSVGCWAA